MRGTENVSAACAVFFMIVRHTLLEITHPLKSWEHEFPCTLETCRNVMQCQAIVRVLIHNMTMSIEVVRLKNITLLPSSNEVSKVFISLEQSRIETEKNKTKRHYLFNESHSKGVIPLGA